MPTMERLEGRAGELLRGRNFCVVSTLREDGTVLAVPVWVDTDGEQVLLNSADGRAWPENVRRTGRATCTVVNQENPYEYVSMTATLAEATHDGADEHIDAMAKKYLGEETYPFRRPGEQRVILRLRPERVLHHGG